MKGKGCMSVVEHLVSMCDIQGSVPSTDGEVRRSQRRECQGQCLIYCFPKEKTELWLCPSLNIQSCWRNTGAVDIHIIFIITSLRASFFSAPLHIIWNPNRNTLTHELQMAAFMIHLRAHAPQDISIASCFSDFKTSWHLFEHLLYTTQVKWWRSHPKCEKWDSVINISGMWWSFGCWACYNWSHLSGINHQEGNRWKLKGMTWCQVDPWPKHFQTVPFFFIVPRDTHISFSSKVTWKKAMHSVNPQLMLAESVSKYDQNSEISFSFLNPSP